MLNARSPKPKHYSTKQPTSLLAMVAPQPSAGMAMALTAVASVGSSLVIDSKQSAVLPALLDTAASIIYGSGGDNRSLLIILGLLLLVLTGLLFTIPRRQPDWRYLSSLNLSLLPRGEYIPRQAPETNDLNTDSLYLLHYPHNRGSPVA